MNRILIETHKKHNIDLLKVRDFFFDKARKLNSLKIFFMIFPVSILVLSYIPFLRTIVIIEVYRDYYIGIITIVLYFVTRLITKKIESFKFISNVFREKYDCNVFGIDENIFLYSKSIIDGNINKAQYVNDRDKYEYWYEEIFGDNDIKNILCCQMDNICYTNRVYNDTKTYYLYMLCVPMAIMVFLWLIVKDISFFVLSIITLFNVFQMIVEYLDISSELIESNKGLKDSVKDKNITWDKKLIRCLQDVVYNNRDKSLFIPKFIRDKYLKDGNAFYNDLNEIKKLCMLNYNISIPCSSDDIDVLSSIDESSVKLSYIQKRLITILNDIKSVFDKNNITYTLDGGTLIGAVREKGKFIFWDDDIDIAIKYQDLDRAKKCLLNDLSYKYDIQDYYNEKYYSPRLSNFRIREKNTKSFTEEKDSPLADKYKMKGIFVDVYSYSPILVNLFIDKMFRKLIIHPIHKRIKNIEMKWVTDKNKFESLFFKLKNKYMKIVEWYLDKANCESYYAYTPNYIEDIINPGPYIKNTDLYGGKLNLFFVNNYFPVPTKPEKVLEAFYGKNWYKSPYKSITDLDGNYDKKTLSVSSLKHLRYAKLFNC